MQRAEIILQVKRVLLPHVIVIFNQRLYHRSLRKNRCIFRLPRLHTQLCVLNIDFIAKHKLDFEQNLSSLPAFVIRRIDRSLKSRSFASSSFDKVTYTAFCEECNNLVCTRNKIQARRFGSANLSLSSCKHCKIHVHTV